MCIIVIKPANKPLPSRDTLMNCYENNSDGAGFMYVADGVVHYRKGYFSFEEFYRDLTAIDDIESTPIIMHFRISTCATIDEGCCHPFPLSNNETALRSVSGSCDIAMAHNGVIHGMRISETISDTMAFVRDYAYPVYTLNNGFLHNSLALEMLEDIAESKLCFLCGTGDIVTIGDYIEDNGILYSNTSYLLELPNFNKSTKAFDYSDYYPFSVCEYCSLRCDCAWGDSYCLNVEEAEKVSSMPWDIALDAVCQVY